MSEQEIKVKMPEEIQKGVYANQMVVSHTKEEFVLDFISFFPPEGVVTARVIVSPGHMKRIIEAIEDNLSKYESNFGEIDEAPELKASETDLRVN